MLSDDKVEEDLRYVLPQAGTTQGRGWKLYEWWIRTHERMAYKKRFPLMVQRDAPLDMFGFFDQVPIGREIVPVMGGVQEVMYDHLGEDELQALGKRDRVGGSAARSQDEHREICNHVREYALRYFMRNCSVRKRPAGGVGDPLNWCTTEETDWSGYAFEQLYHRDTVGRVRAFDHEDRSPIDLIDFARRYEWILLRVQAFDFSFEFPLLGEDRVRLRLLSGKDAYAVLSPRLITDLSQNQELPGEIKLSANVVGEYGFTYVIVPIARPDHIYAYHRGSLTHGFVSIVFRVFDDGEVRVRHAWAANQPLRMLEFDPIDRGFDLMDRASLGMFSPILQPMRQLADRNLPEFSVTFGAISLLNMMTGNLPEKYLAISKERVLKNLMSVQMTAARDFLLGTIQTWNKCSNWANEDAVPHWAKLGKLAAEDE